VNIALSAAETGHLVLSTLHTIDAGQTVNRILGMFDPEEQEQVLKAIDKAASPERSRSRILEDAAREFLERRKRALREERDLAILNDSADALNSEMEDVLGYQRLA